MRRSLEGQSVRVWKWWRGERESLRGRKWFNSEREGLQRVTTLVHTTTFVSCQTLTFAYAVSRQKYRADPLNLHMSRQTSKMECIQLNICMYVCTYIPERLVRTRLCTYVGTYVGTYACSLTGKIFMSIATATPFASRLPGNIWTHPLPSAMYVLMRGAPHKELMPQW